MARARKTAETAWLERTNPLTGLSIRTAQGIFDAARNGDTQRLHWLFQETEATNPVLLTCVERRAAAISGFQWGVSVRPSRDGALADKQKDAVERLLDGIENLTETFEHLDLAFFRGFSHAQPVWEADGTVREVFLPDSWQFLRDRYDGDWYYNPLCTGMNGDAKPCADARLMTVVRRRPIDYPALGINIRSAVGERDWGRFLERHALPKPILTMHPGATNEQRNDYLEAASAIENGQVATVPAGASVADFAGGSRGVDPFNNFIEHQQKLIVLLATGGTLTSLAQADTGSLAGGAQMDVWKEIVARDAAVVAQAVNRALVRPFLAEAFRGKPCAVEFAFETAHKATPQEAADVAATLKTAGWKIEQAELEEATGFTLVPIPDAPAPRPDGLGTPFLNKEHNPPNNTEREKSSGPERTYGAADDHGVLAAFAKDTGPAAEAIARLLENPTPEAAAGLIERLPSLIPEDPALAAVIAEEMAKEFCKPLMNKTDANGNEHGEAGSGNGGRFASKDGGSSGAPPAKAESEHVAAEPDAVKKFQEELPKKISAEDADALLTAGFTDTDGEGNSVRYGTLLRDHLDTNGHSENDIKARKARLGIAVKMVRESKPQASGNPNKPNERVYFGLVDGKAYVAVADEHREIESPEMVSYRRDGRRDER